jgi:hypothetical protein
MLHLKSHYQSLNYNGYTWSGYWSKRHHFTKREGAGYLHIQCTEEQLTNGDIEFMCEHGLSYEKK